MPPFKVAMPAEELIRIVEGWEIETLESLGDIWTQTPCMTAYNVNMSWLEHALAAVLLWDGQLNMQPLLQWQPLLRPVATSQSAWQLQLSKNEMRKAGGWSPEWIICSQIYCRLGTETFPPFHPVLNWLFGGLYVYFSKDFLTLLWDSW